MRPELRPNTIKLVSTTNPNSAPFTLEPDECTLIGRSIDCAVCIEDPSASRKHLTIACHDGVWMATDLGSKHGTFLNATQLTRDEPFQIWHNDTLRVGTHVFKIDLGEHNPQATIATTKPASAQGSVIESLSPNQLDSLAHHRLNLLIEGCYQISKAQNETQLAQAAVDLCLSGTGFPRTAILRWDKTLDEVEVLVSHCDQQAEPHGFEFSRSLIEAAATGSVAKLTSQSKHNYGQSIVGLGISQALCAPLIIDETVIGAIYLDVRDGEPLPQPDAASFCHAVSQIASLSLSNLNRLELVHQQRELDADLKIAQEAQSFLLPAPSGTIGNLRYTSKTCPGSAVGGDLFDIFQIDDTKTGICFGDITGHGIGAAILMTALHTHLRLMLQTSGDPATAVSESNTYLTQHSSARMFATLWVGVFDSTDNSLTYVDAGHGHWLICSPNNPPSCPQPPQGMIVGIQPELEYANLSLTLHPTDRLILYSDGLVEQPRQDGIRFEHDRLSSELSKSTSIEQDIESSFAALNRFIENARFADDTSMASISMA